MCKGGIYTSPHILTYLDIDNKYLFVECEPAEERTLRRRRAVSNSKTDVWTEPDPICQSKNRPAECLGGSFLHGSFLKNNYDNLNEGDFEALVHSDQTNCLESGVPGGIV